MKKTVKVEDIIRLAKNWSIDCNKLILENKNECAGYYREKANTCLSLIMILAYKGEIDNFDEKWTELYNEIWGE